LEEGEQPIEIAERIAAEILSTCRADVTIHQNGRRTVLQEVEMPLNGNHDARLLEGKPVVVASGGALGVTAACLIALAEIAPLRLVLLGRTAFSEEPRGLAGIQDSPGIQSELLRMARANGLSPTPKELSAHSRNVLTNREISRTLTTLKSLGSEAIYLSTDVTDATAVATAMAEVRRTFGPVQILIHAAGILADKSIAEKSAEQFMQVFAPKVLGLRSLLDATADDPLRFICLFSSVAGRYGNAGQADYAMANAALNQIAWEEAQRRDGRCIVRALNWGPWDGGMVTPELRERFVSKGIPVMPMPEGVAAFVRELQHPSHDSAEVDIVLAASLKTLAANR
jgi:NAD(P)-dependent dehydrogenase (short-subunit alcohol dehydrogenase family)